MDFETCRAGIIDRVGKPRTDIPFVESEVPTDLVEVARRYQYYTLPKMLKSIEEAPRVKFIHLHSREEANNYLHSVKGELL